jgi:hypothetical protein
MEADGHGLEAARTDAFLEVVDGHVVTLWMGRRRVHPVPAQGACARHLERKPYRRYGSAAAKLT